MHFDYLGSLHNPVPSLLVSLCIYVELGYEGLDVILVLDSQEADLEVLIQGQIILP